MDKSSNTPYNKHMAKRSPDRDPENRSQTHKPQPPKPIADPLTRARAILGEYFPEFAIIVKVPSGQGIAWKMTDTCWAQGAMQFIIDRSKALTTKQVLQEED